MSAAKRRHPTPKRTPKAEPAAAPPAAVPSDGHRALIDHGFRVAALVAACDPLVGNLDDRSQWNLGFLMEILEDEAEAMRQMCDYQINFRSLGAVGIGESEVAQ